MKLTTVFWGVAFAFCWIGTVVSQTPPTIPLKTLSSVRTLRGFEFSPSIDTSGTIVYTTNSGSFLTVRQPYFSSSPTQLMYNSSVRKELELDDNQIKRLQNIQSDFQKRVSEGMEKFQSTGKPFDHKKWSKQMEKFSADRKAALGAVLLPHQSKRLKEISYQMQMKNQGNYNALVSPAIAEELGIDEEQKKHLKKRAAELRQELAAEMEKLKEKYRDKLIRELKPSQRKKLTDMIGETFEHQKGKKNKH